MATYDHKQVLTDYVHGKITPKMAVGHSLQHIDHLYAARAAARTEWRAEIDALKKQVGLVQATVDRLHLCHQNRRTRSIYRSSGGRQLSADRDALGRCVTCPARRLHYRIDWHDRPS